MGKADLLLEMICDPSKAEAYLNEKDNKLDAIKRINLSEALKQINETFVAQRRNGMSMPTWPNHARRSFTVNHASNFNRETGMQPSFAAYISDKLQHFSKEIIDVSNITTSQEVEQKRGSTKNRPG